MSNPHDVWFLGCLLVTVGVEVGVASWLLRSGRVAINAGGLRNAMLCVVLINLVTHPLAWSVYTRQWAPLLFVECGVMVGEILMLRLWVVSRWRDGCGVGVASNMSTLVLGYVPGLLFPGLLLGDGL